MLISKPIACLPVTHCTLFLRIWGSTRKMRMLRREFPEYLSVRSTNAHPLTNVLHPLGAPFAATNSGSPAEVLRKRLMLHGAHSMDSKGSTASPDVRLREPLAPTPEQGTDGSEE